MTSMCDSPAGVRLDGYDMNGNSLGTTLDLMDADGGILIDSFDVGFPTVRETVAVKPANDGQYDYTQYFGPRTVTITGTFIPSANFTDRQTMMQELASWCAPDIRPHLIYAYDATSTTLWLTVRGSQMSAPASNRHISAFTVSWVASDPAAQSTSVKELSVKAGETAQVVNEGTYTAWPTFRIYGPCRNPHVDWGRGAVSFDALELYEGERIDVSPRTRSSSHHRSLDFARTRWGGLAPGVNELSANVPVVVTWRDTYI
jgi:Phage tail protein